jgi:(1->4)-alpha-D-glucan 1-alpha-D-glucosylmutase
MEDVAGEVEQANLPGTCDSHPNWRRRLSAKLDDILQGSEMRRIATLMNTERSLAASTAS